MPLRVYLTGRVAIEHGDVVLGERDFPGRQSRVAFACLTARRESTLPREWLADGKHVEVRAVTSAFSP